MEIHRPRNLGWPRAAALLYGDWGTSKAYVIGLAFAAMGFSSLPIILAVCVLSLIVGLNYIIICRCFPCGGGVYSSARPHGRLLAVIGALLLIADFTVTAALSAWAGLSYLGLPTEWILPASIVVILFFGVLNYFGPHHSGSIAVALALPVVASVVGIIVLAFPHLTIRELELPHGTFQANWVAFVGVILALSGVEAIANLTGVMKTDKGSTPEKPRVGKTATKSILPVALEVSLGTALLAWAVLSLPHSLQGEIVERKDDVLRFAAEHYAGLALGPHAGQIFGWFVGIAFAVLLFSAVNTAVAALIGLMFMMSTDGEMPRSFNRLNTHGVPTIPLMVSIVLPIIVLAVSPGLEALAGLYAIGVVGAIAVNLGSCAFNRSLPMSWPARTMMTATFVLLCGVELTLAHTKPDALFFVTCVFLIGLALRAWSQKHKGITTVQVPRKVAEMVEKLQAEDLKPVLPEGGKILVCLRGVTPVMKYAIETAKIRNASLYVLYVREVAVAFGATEDGAKARWQDDPEAALIMKTAQSVGEQAGVKVIPVYAVAEKAGAAIADVAATLGVDELYLGASGHTALAHLLHGSVVQQVVKNLPDDIAVRHPRLIRQSMANHASEEIPQRLSAQLRELADREEHNELTLGSLMEELQGRVYTLLLLVLALPMCQPVPLPGLSTPFGVAIALLGLRFALSQRPWMPKRILATKLSGNFFPAVMRGGARVLGVFEKLLHPRMTGVFEFGHMRFLAGAVVCFCGLLLLLPLPIPGTNMLPALTVILTAAAFSERDGYCLIAAGITFLLTLAFFGALIWGGAEIIGHLAPHAA